MSAERKDSEWWHVPGCVFLVWLLFGAFILWVRHGEGGLLRAAAAGNIAEVRAACSDHPLSGDGPTDGRGRTLVHLAAEAGHYDVVEYLVERGWHADAVDANGRKPLWYALSSHDDRIAKYLLEHSVGGTGDDSPEYDGTWEGTTSQGKNLSFEFSEKGSRLVISLGCHLIPTDDSRSGRGEGDYSVCATPVSSVIFNDRLLSRGSAAYESGPWWGDNPPRLTLEMDGRLRQPGSAEGTLLVEAEGFRLLNLTWTARLTAHAAAP